uniref:Peptidase S53 domain-containing protein n=1 Tax=viral metagenome TaxID=1070528 RepID=A0A6C0KS20_9ZZZZ
MASIITPYSDSLKASASQFGLSTHCPTPALLDVFGDDKTKLTIWANAHNLTAPVVPYSMKSRMHLIPHGNPQIKPAANASYFNMNQVRTIYNIPAPVKSNYVVGVVSFGGGLYGSVDSYGVLSNGDVQKYWTALGIAPINQPRVIIVPIAGAKNKPNINDGGSTMENTLDVETIGSACPTSSLTIILYIAPNTLAAFPTLLNYMRTTNVTVSGVNYKPNLISCSWGAPEIYYSSSLIANINTELSALTAAGISICVATGDNGSNDGVGGSGNYIDFPSSNPNVTAVGGTSLICPSGNYDNRTVESAWSSGGGGVSSVYSKPAYQSKISGTMRSIPDLASLADPNTGVVFIVNGQNYVIGGTSVAAPIIAGYLAAIVSKRFINPILYAAPSSCFHDIIRGSNGSYAAKVGYDNCTGLGSIIGATLQSQLKTT